MAAALRSPGMDDRRSWGNREIRFRLRRVDPDLERHFLVSRRVADESFRVQREGLVQGFLPRGDDRWGAAVMDGLRASSCRSPSGDARCCTRRRRFWQYPRPSWMEPKRSGKPGRYFRVLNCASEYGLSLEVCGRESDLVTPRSASSRATGLLVIEGPRSECMVSWSGSIPCRRQVSAIRLLGQRGALPRGQHPAGHIAAVDVQEDVEVEVGPLHRAEQLGDVPATTPGSGAVASSSGFWYTGWRSWSRRSRTSLFSSRIRYKVRSEHR